MKVGDRVTVIYAKYLTRADQLKLKALGNQVTVDDLDVINDEIFGFYSVEFQGYLFTADEVEDDFILEEVD